MSAAELKHPARTSVRKDSALYLVIAERRRQIDELGYGPESDDKDAPGNIALAGSLLAASAVGFNLEDRFEGDVWPWENWDKRNTNPGREEKIRMLTKGAALIVAELEKILRNA